MIQKAVHSPYYTTQNREHNQHTAFVQFKPLKFNMNGQFAAR